MSLKIQVDIVSAEELLFSGETEFAVFPGESGELGIHPRHLPVLTRIKPGTVRLKIPERDDYELIFVSGGILEVQPQQITVLADTAIRAKDWDEAQALKAKELAAEHTKRQTGKMNIATAEAELAQSVANLRNLRRKSVQH